MQIQQNLLKFINDPYKYVHANPTSNLKYFLIPIGWTFQGLLYADKTEKLYKICLDLALVLTSHPLIIYFTNAKWSIMYAFISAHTFNWFFNSGFWGHFRKKYGLFIRGVVIPYQMDEIKDLQTRIKKDKSIQAAAIYGSISRSANGKTSDLDVRIIRHLGVLNGFRACTFGFIERTRAFFKRLPLDLYVVDGAEHLYKLRADEMPVILHDPHKILENMYKTSGLSYL